MAVFKLYGDIMPKSVWDKIDEQWLGFPLGISLEDVQNFLTENSNDTEHTIRINSQGGYLSEAFYIYDALKNSGKTIKTVNDGMTASAAVICLLAGSERKTYEHGELFVHDPGVEGDFFFMQFLTSDDMQKYANELKSEKSRIVDLYTQVTGKEKAVFENLMTAESKILASQGLSLNFYTEIIRQPIPELANHMINFWSKNQTNQNNMTKIDEINKKVDEILGKVKNYFTPAKNYDFTAEDGTVLFSTEKEDDSIAVGDAASPAGSFTLIDGRIVTIEEVDGVTQITEIAEPTDEDEGDTAQEIADLKNEIADLKAEISQSKNLLTQTSNALKELKNTYSNYVPKNRQQTESGKRSIKSEYEKNKNK